MRLQKTWCNFIICKISQIRKKSSSQLSEDKMAK